MNDFLFDLQRFVDGGTITVASDGTANTITIPADGTTSTSTEYTFSISGEGIDTKTYSITLGASSAAEISADSTGKVILNVTAGTASSLIYTNYTGDYITNRVPVILLGGNLYLNNFGNPQPVTLDENGPTINLRSSFSDRSTLVKYNSDNKQVEINCSNHTNDPLYLYIGYFTYNLPADLTLNRIYNEETEENKISFALPTQRNSFTYSYTDSTSGLPVSETFSTSGTVNIVADNNNAIYLSDLVNGETFTITKTFNGTTTTTTYTMYNKKLVAEREVDSKKVHKRWTGPDIESTTDVAWSDLDFDSSESLLGDILDIEGSDLTVTSDTLLAANWDGVSTKLIVDSEFKDSAYFDTNNNNITPAYGTLVRESATSFRVELNDAIKNLTSITIGEGLTAKIDSSYTIPITVNTTTFRSLDSLSSDMLSIAAAGNTGTISVGGSESISLGSGSLHTADEDQTVSTSNYTVSSYGHSGTSEDGIIISAESVIGDVDYGESFKVETDAKTSNYTLLSSGIGLLEYRTTGNSSDYYLHSGLGTPTESTGISVNLNSVNGGALIIMPDNNGLDIGGTNTQTAVVFNSKENPTTGYASLYADGDGNYTLSPLDGTFSNGVNKISLMGGSKNKSTTIYKSLVNSGNVTLTAYDSTVSTPTVAATFLVTGASGDTFTVNNITSTPTIENATNITLISGSITVQKNQTIKLGVSGNDLVLSDDLTSTATVTYGSSGWTIAFADGVTGGFTYGGKYYKVGGGDGISFVLSDASVTIDSLNNGDVFYYGNTSINNDIYSVKGAGFIRGSSSNVSLWTNKDSVIPAVSLDSADWKPIITVDSANRLTIPSSITTTARTIIDTEYTTTYGNVQKAGSVYQLDRSSDDSGTLSLISLESNINNISLHGADSSHNFLNVSIFGANTSLKVTEATDNTYEVTLSTDNTHLSGATAAELLRGSLTASSLITGGVVVDGSTVIAASNQEVTLITDSSGSEASIAGIAKNEAFNLDNRNYTLTGAGLLRDDAKLLRRTEEVVYDENINTRKISDILVADSWLGMTAPGSSDSVLTIGNAIQNSLYVVNDTVSPASLFGEVSRESAGSYSLTADGIVDAWNPNYTINLNSVTLSVSSNFKDGKFTGTNSGAAFTVDSLSGNSFVAADRATSSGGASLSGVSKLTQTAGLITGEGINSITVGDKTIHNSSGLPLNVSVSSGSNATLSGLASGEAFSIGNDAYSVNAIGIIANDSLFFKDNSLQPESAALSKLATDSGSWVCIATIENDTLFSVPPTTGDDEWIVLDSAKTTPYATVTKIDDNNYSMDSLQNAWGDATIKVGDGKTLSLSNAFANETISVESGGALFTVRENSAYTVTDSVSANAASIGGGAKTINQTAGTIAINSSEQSIIAGGHSISGAGSDVMVVVSNGNAAVGGLASSEEFTVDGITYRLLSNGRLQRENDDAIWSGTLIATNNSGSVNASDLSLTSNWYGAVKTDSAGKLTIDSVVSNVFTADSVTSALVVNETLHTIIYGTMIHGVNDTLYALNANDSTAPINSIEFTTAVSHVSLTSNFTNVSLTAGDNNFSVRSADDGFTVNYTSSALSVDDASVVDLSNGKMLLDKSNQTITAGGQSVMGASESVNVNYSGSTVVVDDIASAGESLKIGTHTYSLGSGDFDVSIISGNATVGKITSGDKFQIDDATFEYTAAGLTKNNSLGSYLLKSTFPTGNQLALDSLLGTEAWLGTHSVANDVISITSDMGSVILVDNVSNPTKNYGWIDYENSTHTLAKDTNANANPTLIAVGDSVTASISSDFSNVSVTSSNATNIFVTDSASGNHTISGTINRFLPSTMIFTPQAPNDSVSGDVFTVDGENYEMKGAGLTKPKDDLIWTEEVSSYSLPSDDAWSNMISLTSAGVLDFKTEDATDGFNVIVDSDLSTRQGTLTYDSATSSYALTSSGDSISSIQTDDGDASFTTNFATKFITGNGTQSINGKAYTGNNLEIDATTRTSTLTKGTVTIASGAQAVTPTNDTTAAVSVTGGDSITATAAEGKWTSLGALNDGDTFAIKGTTYKVYGSNTLVKLDSSNDPTEIYNPSITGGAISYDSLVGDDYSSIIKLNSSNQLNLRGNPSITSAIVVGQTGGNFDPTNRIAALEYSDGTYSLSTTPGGVVSNMNAVLLGTAVKTFNTDQETTVITSGSTTFNVNNNSFVAQNALTIATKDSKATLTNGTITLSKDATVNTRYNGIDETITETNGEITVNVSNSAVRLSGIDTSDAFTVGNVTYTMTNVGLADSNKKLNYAMLSNGSITTASLSGGSWKDILEAPDGVLTINDSVSATDAYVAYVDTTNPGTAVKYGTLTQAGGTYTLTQNDDNDTVLSSINISGVKAVLPLRCTDTSIVTDNAQIKVSADAPFTIDDTGETLAISNVTAISLESGELQAVSGVPITANGNVITTSDTMTVGIDSTGVYVGDLNADETFTVGETGYKMTSAGLLDTTNKRLATDVTEKYYLGNATFAPIIAADGSTLHLENQTTSAAVYDDLSNPTTHMATLEVKSGKLTLTEENGGIDTIELGEGKTFETDITATVNASGTTTVNGKKYVGTGDLTIDTVGDVTNSTLQKGTITLTSGTSARATSDDTDLTVTSGTISATASAGKFTKIEELDAGDTFTFNGKTYTQSTIGLLTTGDGSTIINTSVESDVTVTNLNNESNWQKILTAPGGELTIDSESGNVLAADVSDATAAVRYGTLTNNRLTLSANDTTPTSVTVADGVKVTLPEACENSTLTAKGVQFSVVASGDFTLDATADVLTMSGGIEEITLTSGELQAVSGVPITANGNVITTSDTMTVGIDSTGVYVGDLNADETFTVGETGYKMTSAGLLDTTNKRLATDVTEKYYLGNATFAPIIAADGSTLHLENQTTSAAVYDDLSNPTTHMATLEVKSGKLTLTEENGGIDTIELGEGKTFETDITATVNASGTTTVNGKKYVGTGDLTIDTVGDVTNSTLQKGTITLTSGTSARATSDDTDLTVTSGTISATASAGKFTKIEELDAGDTFTFNGKTYTQSEVGLINDATISEELAGETLDTAKLSNSAIKWSNFIAPRGGVLDVSNETVDKLVLNDTTTPTKKLADLIVSDELTSLKGTSNATDIDSVTVAEGSTLNVDFATKVNAPSGTVTVNSQKYNAAAEIKIDSDGTTSTLYTGTVNLDDTNYPTVTATNDSSNLKVESGSVTVRAFEGEFVSIGDLDSGESFTFNGKTYTQSAVGLMNEEGEISEVLTGKTISIIDLNSAAWSNIIAPEDGTLDLKAVTTDAIVCDDISNPTERLAAFNFADGTLKDKGNAADTIKFADIADGASLTVDFATQVNAPIGTVTVNTKPYNGTTKLLIDANADGKTSTLTDGTVSLAKDDSVSTTTGNKIMLSDGDGITVTVSGETVTVNGLNTGDIFKVDDNTYKIATGGLINTSGKFWTGKENYSDGLTLDALGLASNWMTAVVAKDGALTVNDNTLANGDTSKIVDDLENPTKTFGTLTRDDDGKYSLKKDEDNALASITVDGVKIDIANDLADVPLTIINSDGTKTVLAAKTSEKYTAFTIDATGNSPIVDNMNSIELSSGKFNLLDGQTLTLAEDFGNVEVTAGNGTFTVGNETFTIAELSDEAKVEFKFDTSGEVETVNGFEENSTATIDGITYTAPEDKAILHYTDVDGWYFDGNPYDEYTVTVDGSGNVLVPAGVKFRDVVSSGNTLAEDGTIKFAANLFKTPVTVINENATALKINDANDYTWAENFGKNSKAKFTGDGVEAESLADVAGTTFNLQGTNTITAGDTKITANADDSPVGIGSGGKSISLEKSAKVEAPADINLTLNAAPYEVNGVDFTASGTTSAVTTDNGVKLDLAASESITYDGMTLNSGTGMATMDNEDNITLTGGAVVTNATNRAVYVDGTVILDDKTINTTQTTKVTETTNGFDTEKRNVTVTGDDDGYTINLANDDVRGLEKIGNSNGVTVDGLYTSTVKTDKAGSFTTNDKTFIYSNDAVTYGFRNGSLSAIDSVNSVIGDFIDNIAVNGDPIKVVGESDEPVTVLGDRRSVDKVEVNSAGVFEVSGKTYEILDDDSFAFDMSKGKVTGIESLESGSLVISQKESGFNVNDEKITLSGNTSPVTLGIDDSEISSVSGLDGTINGLKNATVYDLTSAVINDKLIDVSNTDDFDVIVSGGKAKEISGITDGATVNSAPEMTIGAENGTFTFVNDEYTLNDTLDAVFDFLTDENSRVRGLDNFSGSVSGSFDGFTINGKTLNLADQNVTVETDGENITNIIGLKSGGSIDGEIGDTSLVIPEGEITINGTGFKLEGDEDGATLSGNGSVISGLDKDATLSIDKSGTYTIDGKSFDIQAGDSITANRDGAYKIDPKDPPITEKTDAEDILARGDNPVYIDSTSSGASAVDLSGDNDLALIDSPDARVTVTTGEGTDTVVVRHNADVTVDLDEDGGTLIIPTKGNVTLENYDGDNASVKTYEYSNIVGAVKSNEIKFGDGTMTLGDAIVTFDPEAGNIGSTTANLVNAHGEKQPVAFTHDGGGTIDTSDSTENYLIKGNYAESTDDTQKSGGSSIVAGIGNDTILAGAGDYVDAGNGSNQIYLTDRDLRRSVSEGATILLGDNGSDTVHNFSSGFDGGDDQILIKDLSALAFDYGAADLVMKSGNAQITFDSPTNDNETAYEIKLTDGTNEYNAAIAKENETIQVGDDSAANVFFGNEKGISFSEFTGSVEVNLNEATGNLNGRTAQFFGIDKVEAGAGNSSLIGAADTPNTLIAGTGNSSIWSNSGKDLMVGNTSEDKNGSTTFFYEPGDGRDTIQNFDFMTGTTDVTADYVQFDDFSGVTEVLLRGDDVVIGINNSKDDYLTIVDAKGKSFHVNDDLIAKVDAPLVEYDGFTNCYVGIGNNVTMSVGAGMGDVAIWLSDDLLEYHGIRYDGDFRTIDASQATGNNTLAGNEFDNLIIGGAGSNSIWGGYASSNDTLVGGAGQNTFFFALENGHDVIQGAHDGDVVSLEDIFYDNIVRADVTDGGTFIELNDGSSLEIQSTANIDYRLQDGSTYTVDRTNREFVQK